MITVMIDEIISSNSFQKHFLKIMNDLLKLIFFVKFFKLFFLKKIF